MKLTLSIASAYNKLISWWIKRVDDKRWEARLASAYAVLPGKAAAQLLQNQVTFLRHSARRHEYDFMQRESADRLNNLVFLISVASIQSQLELSKIVSVQPLTGPIGPVLQMASVVNDDTKMISRSLTMSTHGVEARTNKLSIKLDSEILQLAHSNNSRMLPELTTTLGEIAATECIMRVVDRLRELASTTTPESTTDADTLTVKIQHIANEIAMATRRGMGNFVIGNVMAIAKLRAAKCFTPEQHQADIVIRLVGKLNGSINVYEFSGMPTDELLIGYNGSIEADAGYIHSPYIPLIVTNLIPDAETYLPSINCATRNGAFDSNSSAYYTLLKV